MASKVIENTFKIQPPSKNCFVDLGDSSRRSAFLPYKSAVTVLTNLQRGNTKTDKSQSVSNDLSIFHLAARGELSEAEIEKAKNLNAFDSDDCGLTPLMWASAYCQHHTVESLLKSGANVNLHNNVGQTALHFAAYAGSPEVVEILIAHGADVDLLDERENHALLFAVRENHPQAVSALLSHGASFLHENDDGDTAYQLALRMGYLKVLQTLEAHMKQMLIGETCNSPEIKVEKEESYS